MGDTDLSVYRVYEPHECGVDGYPVAWHERIKHEVRAEAGHRCLRCGHPFVVGKSGVMEGPCAVPKAFAAELGVSMETLDAAMAHHADADLGTLDKARRTNWSPCDEHCTHRGPVRLSYTADDGTRVENHEHELATEAGVVVGYGKRVEAAWRILTVHHLNERKHDCRWWNLAALCQRCHLYVQRKVQMERVYPWEHSEWFKPFAAGWYSYAYRGENITRQQAERHLENLLALERVA